LAEALRRMDAHASVLASFVQERAATLERDHLRVRATGVNVPRVSVEAVLPPDVVGLFVLVPTGA